MSLSTSAAPQTADKQEKQEETTLQKMSKEGDRARSQGGVAEERKRDLETAMDEAHRLIARHNGQTVVVSQRTEAERDRGAEKGKDIGQGAARTATIAATIDSSFRTEQDRKANDVLAKIGVEATSARGEVKVALGNVNSIIKALTEKPPGLSIFDWQASEEERINLVRDLEVIKAKLERTGGQFNDLDIEAAMEAGPIGQEPRAERAKRRIAA